MKKAYLNENGSSETIVTAIFLVTAVIAVGFLINAILPVVSTMSGTFQSSTNAADEKLRTDFKIVATYAAPANVVHIYMKNTGSNRISIAEIKKSDVICGADFKHLTYTPYILPIASNLWTTEFATADDSNEYDLWLTTSPPGNLYWDPGETLHVIATPSNLGDPVFFQFILPNGVSRSIKFPAVS